MGSSNVKAEVRWERCPLCATATKQTRSATPPEGADEAWVCECGNLIAIVKLARPELVR